MRTDLAVAIADGGVMNSFESLTRDGFEALETRQNRLALERLDAMLLQLQDLDNFLTEYLAGQPPKKAQRKASIPAR